GATAIIRHQPGRHSAAVRKRDGAPSRPPGGGVVGDGRGRTTVAIEDRAGGPAVAAEGTAHAGQSLLSRAALGTFRWPAVLQSRHAAPPGLAWLHQVAADERVGTMA